MTSGPVVAILELLLVVIAGVLALVRVAERISVPRPVLLVIAGVAWGLLRPLFPHVPSLTLTPDLVFVVFLPPLLVAGAYETPLGFVRSHARSVALLAVGLVLATDAVVALLTHALLPEMPLAAAFVLGAIVSPPDPAAAAEIARRVGLPNRLANLLKAEGLINDATALTAYSLALSAVSTGTFTFRMAAQQFVQATAGGVAIGWALAWVAARVLEKIDDEVVEVTITLMLPYAAYIAAEQLSASGVLSAVAAGFTLRGYVGRVHQPSTRLTSRAVWATVVFVIDALVTVMMGFALGAYVARGPSRRVAAVGAVVAAAAIALRIAWMLVVPHLTRAAPTSARAREPPPPARELFVLGWAGMRGVVSLAATLSVPMSTARGPFPQRDALVLIAFEVIIATLIVQGLTLPMLTRALGVADPGARRREEERARRAALDAALAQLDALARDPALPDDAVTALRRTYEDRARTRDGDAEIRRLHAEANEAERDAVMRLRSEGQISDEVAQRMEGEIDLRYAQHGGRPASRS